MNLAILFLLSVGLLGFGLESYAVEFTDSTGHIPDWAINAEQEQVIIKCESGDYSEKDVDWCLEYLESLLVELKNDPIILEMEAEFAIPDAEPTVDPIPDPIPEPTPDPEPVPDPKPEPTCGAGTELVNGFCQVIKTPKSSNDPTCGTGTILKNGQCIVDTSKSSKGGGCLIATATYGSELAPQVQKLREIRDNSLLQTESGMNFMNIFNDVYYSFSPVIADYERENPVFKEMVKVVITPMITSLSLMEYADSESSVLGYGISLIVLNGLMYVGVPIAGIIVIRKRF